MRIELGTPMLIGDIAKAIGGKLFVDENIVITHLSTDSREVMWGDLFIALKGKNFDGENYVAQAKESGAYALSGSETDSDIYHPDTNAALLDFASYYVKTLPYLLYKIGITGSVGKTTTKEFLKVLLKDTFITHASEGNYNNEIGLPLSVLQAKPSTQILILEMGMNSRGEISRLSKCLKPDIAIITNIGSAHIGRLGSRENIAAAKSEILDGMNGGKIILPKEEKLLSHIKENLTFSLTDIKADCYIKNSQNDNVEVYLKGENICTARFALTGKHHKECLVCAVATALCAGLATNFLEQNISKISNVNIRQKLIFAEDYHFYADCYNASRESMLSSIRAFVEATPPGKRSLLLGDILELGEMRKSIHREVGRVISPADANSLFLFGESSYEIGIGAMENGFPQDKIFVVSDKKKTKLMADIIRLNCSEGEHILVKASRGIELERVLAHFKESEENKPHNE